MTKMTQDARVCASIVTYNPDPGKLSALIEAVTPQVAAIVVVDNASAPGFLPQWINSGPVTCLPQQRNIGVAAAHNISLSWARRHGFTHLLLFDQDSKPAADMVARLLEAEAALLDRGIVAGMLGPAFRDVRNHSTAPFIRRENWKILKIDASDADESGVVRADYLITSGSLVTLSMFDRIGGLDEGLFIDYVDIEWGLRALSHGYPSFGVVAAGMEHELGDSPLQIPLINKSAPLHSPLRHYYHFRNAILVYKKKHACVQWIFNDAYRLALKFIVYSLFTRDGMAHFKMMLRGIRDGLAGVDGQYIAPSAQH